MGLSTGESNHFGGIRYLACMKKLIFTAMGMLAAMIMLQSFSSGLGKKDGTEPGYTGSPGDTLKNCTVCHGGTAMEVDPSWVTSNIPAEGYIPGATYRLRATNTEFGATRFGFEVSPQALNGTMLGTMVITDTARTKLVGDGKYITYREAGVDGVDSNSWEFDWIAPVAGTGEVIFYGAFNSNFDGHKEGDKTFLSTLKVQEAGTTGLSSIDGKISNLSVYPNPANDHVTISFEAKAMNGNMMAELTDLTGKQMSVSIIEKQNGTIIQRLNTGSFPAGIYFLRIDGKTVRKINVVH
jgi:hypothetical protein